MNVVKDVKTNIQKIIESKMMLAILVMESIESEEEIILENIEPEEEEEVEIMEVKEEHLEEDIIEAMGPPISNESSYGQPIHPEIYKRVEGILMEGLTKEKIETYKKEQLIPENTILLEAPLLNPELHMIQESVKTRDKKIENRQNSLGLATGTILKGVDNLTKQNFNKLDIIKNMTEAARRPSPFRRYGNKKKFVNTSLR
ncbi:unnamed protein product [Parnassius apollo]|uniref:(apollo) hypothetical protein n=1 Tax=Parnassius apollo TaxID=110799 RepID=A0A8S3WP24_PARAO|nr:unnamed protein product [Parnassius apollo]